MPLLSSLGDKARPCSKNSTQKTQTKNLQIYTKVFYALFRDIYVKLLKMEDYTTNL